VKNDAAVKEDILGYLAENPMAQDTFEGIAEWWLLSQRIEQATHMVRSALDQLVLERKVCVHRGADGRIHYRLQKSLAQKNS